MKLPDKRWAIGTILVMIPIVWIGEKTDIIDAYGEFDGLTFLFLMELFLLVYYRLTKNP